MLPVVNVSKKSIKGKNHSVIEDSYLVRCEINSSNCRLFIVCDGVGGYPGGDIASKMVIETFKESSLAIGKSYELETTIESLLQQVNQDLIAYGKKNPEYRKLSTTIAGLVMDEKSIVVFNVGDSRIYLRDLNGFKQLTRDDSIAWERYEEGIIHKNQINKQKDKNIITAALGLKESFEVHFRKVEFGKYFQILLCSDGLTDFVDDCQIEKILSDEKKLEIRAEELVKEALNSGSDDDITILLIEGRKQ